MASEDELHGGPRTSVLTSPTRTSQTRLASRSGADDEWADLIVRAIGGDETAWRSLYETYSVQLLEWLARRPEVGAGIDPEDLAMECWGAAVLALPRFHGNRRQFARWLFRIARKQLVSVCSTASQLSTLGRGELPETADELDITEHVDVEDAIRRAIVQLPAREAHVVTCIDLHNLSPEATADLLGTTRASVTAARGRALKRLRVPLERWLSPSTE